MATLGKGLKGSAAKAAAEGGAAAVGAGRKGASTAKNAILKAKMKVLEDSDNARKLTDQSKRLLQERFRVEVENAKSHRAKVEAAWMHLLRMATVSSLRADVETLAAQHERDCAYRDATLRMMFDDLMAAEEQYRVALFSHLQQMDRLIELQDARITDLETTFDEELRHLANDFTTEMAAVQQQHVLERRELRTLIATATEREEAAAAEAEHAHVTAREEIRNRSTDRIQELSRALDDRIMELEAAFEQAHVNYLHATDTKTEAFKALVTENTKAEKRIARRAEAVERAKAALVSLRNKMAGNAREYEEKNAALANEKLEQAAHVAALKARLEAFRASSDARLQRCSVAVRDAASVLESHVHLASCILQDAERCRQLEGEEERVWGAPVPDVAAGVGAGSVVAGPCASTRVAAAIRAGVQAGGGVEESTEAAVAHAQLEAAAATLTSGALVPLELTAAHAGFIPRADGLPVPPSVAPSLAATGGSTMRERAVAAGVFEAAYGVPVDSELMKDTLMSGELDALELFWRRYNKALLDKLAAQRYKESLEKENRELREALEQCLAGTTLGADTIAKGAPNPLFIVNGRSGVQQQAPPILGARDARVSALPHVTTIDATATMRVYASHARA